MSATKSRFSGSYREPIRTFVPEAAIAAGIPARYRYWSGQSGRRYVFTRIPSRDAAEFAQAVLLVARGDVPIWAGSALAWPDVNWASKDPSHEFYVHLLAAGEPERHAIADDLLGARQSGGDLQWAA